MKTIAMVFWFRSLACTLLTAAARGPILIRGGTWLGSLLLVVSLSLRLVTIPLPIPFLGDVAFLIGLTGLFTLILGSAALERYWFALFFLIFMVPLPITLIRKLPRPYSY